MANKADRFFYENLVESAECSCRAADFLVKCLSEYSVSSLRAMLDTMHELEHEGDTKKHEMTDALARAFVTPIDREDLALISQNIDDVTDIIEEILQRFYMDELSFVTDDGIHFAKKLSESCSLMRDMLRELPNFKKPAKLREMLISINNVEEECDVIYLEATKKIRHTSSEVLEIIAWRKIYDIMESCADACEHVADCVGTIIMKNT